MYIHILATVDSFMIGIFLKGNRSTTCNLLIQRYNTEAFFDGDENLVPYGNPKRKRNRHEVHPKEAILGV